MHPDKLPSCFNSDFVNVTPEELNAQRLRQRGAGSIALSPIDMFVLSQMYFNDPSTSLKAYAQGLMLVTGTQVHPTTISR